ncbi:hypothetical protein G6F56_009429 [Rhizopus delemar]|nr:hypothetical protein G6F56_009429 [Rhizopus delemar]
MFPDFDVYRKKPIITYSRRTKFSKPKQEAYSPSTSPYILLSKSRSFNHLIKDDIFALPGRLSDVQLMVASKSTPAHSSPTKKVSANSVPVKSPPVKRATVKSLQTKSTLAKNRPMKSKPAEIKPTKNKTVKNKTTKRQTKIVLDNRPPKRKLNLVAHLKGASGQTENMPRTQFDFSDDEELWSSPPRERTKSPEQSNEGRTKLPEQSYEERMEKELEVLMLEVEPTPVNKRPRYQPLNEIKVRVTY